MTFQFASIMDFFLMNGHGAYVWSSYMITFIVLVVIAVYPFIRRRQFVNQLQRQQRIENQPVSTKQMRGDDAPYS